MQRVLDLDLDAFVYGSVHWRERNGPRLDPDEYPPWDVGRVLSFLESNCGLDGPLPGCAVEHHGDVFFRWKEAIDSGVLTPPFEVVHVDAHADLGLGDCGYMYLLTELLREPVERRRSPRVGDDALGDGNYLCFAIAAGWISDLRFVIGGRRDDPEDDVMTYRWQPGDLLPYLFEDFDFGTRTIRLPTLERKNLEENLISTDRLKPLALGTPVPFDWLLWHEFRADQAFDFVCLARSPAFTPEASDVIYDEIKRRFINEEPASGAG